MNPMITRYFDAVEARMIQSPAVISYRIIRREIAFSDGKLRIKSALSDGGTAEFFIYISETDGQIHHLKYSFHWQDPQQRVKQRWDNAPHYPDLPNAPHHRHDENNAVWEVRKPPDVFFVIETIEKHLEANR